MQWGDQREKCPLSGEVVSGIWTKLMRLTIRQR